MLRSLVESPAIRTAVVYGFGGVFFAAGSIALASGMARIEFAAVALVIAISQISYGVGALGVDTVINRYVVNASTTLLLRVSTSSLAVAVILAIGSHLVYEISGELLVIQLVLCVCISLNQVASSFFRSRQRFGLSLLISQVHNVVIALASVMVLTTERDTAVDVCAVLAAAYFVSALLAWLKVFRDDPITTALAPGDIPWSEGLSIVGMGAAVVLLIQLERLLIPNFLGADTLAVFAVLAAIVGSSFRVLQMAIGFTLLPRLRAARDVAARRRLLFTEGLVAFVAVAVSIGAIYAFLPLIVEWFLEDKYSLDAPLVVAAICAGVAKVIASFSQASAKALCSSRELFILNVVAWISLGIGTLAAIKGSTWGLPGLIYGASLAWVLLGITGGYIVLPYIRNPEAVKKF